MWEAREVWCVRANSGFRVGTSLWGQALLVSAWAELYGDAEGAAEGACRWLGFELSSVYSACICGVGRDVRRLHGGSWGMLESR